jgi:mRNA-degrading endonuclease toxin of MazEF toxin-antitoxin module
VPNQDFNGTVQLGYYAWDQTQSWAGGVFDISTDNKLGGTTAFSTGLHFSNLTVNPVNDAPKWPNGDPRPAMVVQNEDDRLAIGTTVASLTTTASDVDAGAIKGIAIFSAPTDKGVWQFTINGGTAWSTLPPTTRTNARMLPANGNLSRVRFVPNQDFNGTVQLGYYAWDQTQSWAGGVFDISTDNKIGGTTAFSTGLHFSNLTVNPVNDAPKWPNGDPRPAMVVQNEDDRLAIGTTVASLTTTASDVDAGAIKGIAIFSAPTDKGVWQFTINGGTTWSTMPATTRTNARMLPANGTLSRVRFVPNQDFNGTVQLGYYAWDQTQSWAGGVFDISTANKIGGTTAFSTGYHFSNLTVSPVNDAPKWPNGDPRPPMVVQNEDDRLAIGTTVASLTTTASDVDAGATKGIAIFSAPTDKGVWQFTINGGTTWTNLPATTRSNARLLPANGNLSRVRFVPNKDFNGTVQLGFYAWDQTQGTAGSTFDISTVNKIGGTTAFSTGFHFSNLTVSAVPG